MEKQTRRRRSLANVLVIRAKSKTRKKITSRGKIFIYAVALAALGGGGYLLYDRMRRKKTNDQTRLPESEGADTIIINNTLPISYAPSTKRSDSFPLRRGSRGTNVTLLQQALLKTNPLLKVDGQFGTQTASALKNSGYSETVDAALFSKITGANAMLQLIFNPAVLAEQLYKASQGKNLSSVLSILAQIKSTVEYSSVNDYYKKQSFISKTIVTDLLDYAFKGNTDATEQIRKQFLRIGLKVNSGGTWSLQGLKLYRDVITIRSSVVTDAKGNKIPVRKSTILGDEVKVENGVTWFRSIDNNVLKVPTQDVKYT